MSPLATVNARQIPEPSDKRIASLICKTHLEIAEWIEREAIRTGKTKSTIQHNILRRAFLSQHLPGGPFRGPLTEKAYRLYKKTAAAEADLEIDPLEERDLGGEGADYTNAVLNGRRS